MTNHCKLEAATHRAVKDSKMALLKTQRTAKLLIRDMKMVAEELVGSPDGDTASSHFVALVEERTNEIGRLFSRQASVVDSFNIVLFGRTGAGKSTLIETLVRGNGQSVSHGESDWTTDVAPRIWQTCKVYDTPGVNGWGRNNSRADLELRARNAVEVADFVLLCFDSQSQQASEFAKVADWVQTFNKPVVAVLNSRNAIWRMPPRVAVGSARANLSRTVAQHIGNIQDELAAVGLRNVPVVAIASKRALFARAAVPYVGPDSETLELHRAKYGVGKLDAWSNIQALEGLLVRCIEDHAISLRLGSLHDQLRGVLDTLAEGMQAIGGKASREAGVVEKQTIDPLLKLLGYPTSEHDRRPYFRDEIDRLQELEKIRGRFQAPANGEFSVFVRQRLVAELGALRSRSLAEAEEAVAYAFDRGIQITPEEVQKKTFSGTEMEAAAQKVLNEAHEFVTRRAHLASRDSIADLKAQVRESTGVKGGAGTGWKYGSWGLKGVGIGSGVIGGLATLALANSWNPLGWTAGVAAGVLVLATVASTFFGWLGGKARKRAEEQKLKARREALANVRKSVHDVYDEFTDRISKAAAKIAASAAGQAVLPAIELALDRRKLTKASERIANQARVVKDQLPPKAAPQALLWLSKETCERDADPGRSDAAQRLWLGESWIHDPEGLEQMYCEGEQQRTSAYDPGFFETLFTSLRDTWTRISSGIVAGSGNRWLMEANAALKEDDLAAPVQKELADIATRGRPRVHLVGDYNAGKSTFIKRLLLDAGMDVPGDLRVRGNPTTAHECTYEWNKIDLVDTPGFQSTNTSHTEIARRCFPDASAVIYLFQPNLVTGDDTAIRVVLKGNYDEGLVPKSPRTFFIINRSDELGVDPIENPRRYKELVERKRQELSEALASRGILVDPERILCMASDPFGLVGDREDATSAAFDAYRAWDGFDHFMQAYRQIEAELMFVGVDRSLLEGGLARIARLDARRADEKERLLDQYNAIARLRTMVMDQIAEGKRISAEQRARLIRLLDTQTASMKDDILGEIDPIRLKLKAQSLQKWWEDEAVSVELKQWLKETQQKLENWQSTVEEAISRRLESAEFRGAFPEPPVCGSPDAPSEAGGKAWYHDTFDKAGRVLGGATRDVVYGIGKALKFKFKPWGAVKLARNLSKAGTVIAVIGIAWDVFDSFREEKRQSEREASRKKLAEWLANAVPVIAASVAEGTEQEPGLLRAASKYIADLEAYATELSTEQTSKQTAINAINKHREVYARLRSSAISALGGNLWEQ